jgi:hypothetical protein
MARQGFDLQLTRAENKVAQPAEQLVLPMELQIGDLLVDETGEWEVAARPYVTNAGKDAHVRVKKVGQPEITEIRSWAAHERVAIKRQWPFSLRSRSSSATTTHTAR